MSPPEGEEDTMNKVGQSWLTASPADKKEGVKYVSGKTFAEAGSSSGKKLGFSSGLFLLLLLLLLLLLFSSA